MMQCVNDPSIGSVFGNLTFKSLERSDEALHATDVGITPFQIADIFDVPRQRFQWKMVLSNAAGRQCKKSFHWYVQNRFADTLRHLLMIFHPFSMLIIELSVFRQLNRNGDDIWRSVRKRRI
jgi:hypothetical protein